LKFDIDLTEISKLNQVGLQGKRVTDWVDNSHGHLQRRKFRAYETGIGLLFTKGSPQRTQSFFDASTYVYHNLVFQLKLLELTAVIKNGSSPIEQV